MCVWLCSYLKNKTKKLHLQNQAASLLIPGLLLMWFMWLSIWRLFIFYLSHMLCSLFVLLLTSFELCIFSDDSILSPCWFISSNGCTITSPVWTSKNSPSPSLSSGSFLTCTHWSTLICVPLGLFPALPLTKGDFQALPVLTLPVPQPGNCRQLQCSESPFLIFGELFSLVFWHPMSSKSFFNMLYSGFFFSLFQVEE